MALLNIPESQVQSLWQQWPVCGYDVLGYCHRNGIPHAMTPRRAESKIGRAFSKAFFNPIEAAIWKAISEESTSWKLPSNTVTLTSTTGKPAK